MPAQCLILLVLLLLVVGCGGGDEEGSVRGKDKGSASTEFVPDRQKADGEGLAEFVVKGFNEALLGCDYRRTVAGLRQQIRLFEPNSQSGLFGEYSPEEYTGEPDPTVEGEYSRENPPPTRDEELRTALGLFPNGRLAYDADGSISGSDYAEIKWPFSNDNGLDLEALGGVSFVEVCRLAIRNMAGEDPTRLKASYRRAGVDGEGNPSWILSFPIGSVSDDDGLQVLPVRQLVVREGPAGWSIVKFIPR